MCKNQHKIKIQILWNCKNGGFWDSDSSLITSNWFSHKIWATEKFLNFHNLILSTQRECICGQKPLFWQWKYFFKVGKLGLDSSRFGTIWCHFFDFWLSISRQIPLTCFHSLLMLSLHLLDLNSELSNKKVTSSNISQTSSRDDLPFKHLASKLCPSSPFSFKNWMASYFVMHKWNWFVVAMLTELEFEKNFNLFWFSRNLSKHCKMW